MTRFVILYVKHLPCCAESKHLGAVEYLHQRTQLEKLEPGLLWSDNPMHAARFQTKGAAEREARRINRHRKGRPFMRLAIAEVV
jgi:hypothetical protein